MSAEHKIDADVNKNIVHELYEPASPSYVPTSTYCPTSPEYNVSYCPTSPVYNPSSVTPINYNNNNNNESNNHQAEAYKQNMQRLNNPQRFNNNNNSHYNQGVHVPYFQQQQQGQYYPHTVQYQPQQQQHNAAPRSWNEISGIPAQQTQPKPQYERKPRKEYVVRYTCVCGNCWGSTREEQKNRYMRCKHCNRSRLPDNCDLNRMNDQQIQDSNKSRQYMAAGWNAVSAANQIQNN